MAHSPEPIPAPWVLIDDHTVNQTADLLQRLAGWLEGTDTAATRRCARALSRGESDDPETISGWADALAARLCRLTEDSQLDPQHHADPY